MNCSDCGFANPAGMKFCGECGTPMKSSCGSCGFENPPGFKFCGECGATIGVAQVEGEDPRHLLALRQRENRTVRVGPILVIVALKQSPRVALAFLAERSPRVGRISA